MKLTAALLLGAYASAGGFCIAQQTPSSSDGTAPKTDAKFFRLDFLVKEVE